jgi:nucleoside-diphosphate-sugar epimerase
MTLGAGLILPQFYSKKDRMRVFLTGASGFIGSALAKDLLSAGYEVTGLARSDASAQALTAAGITVIRGSLEDLDSLRRGAAESDAVIHTAYIHDFTQYQSAGEKDKQAIITMCEALAGSNRPFVMTSGTAGLTPGGSRSEDDPGDLSSPMAPRLYSEFATIEYAEKGVRTAVVRLPPSVHGDDDKGFVPMLINGARQSGFAAYVGDGAQRWPAVHRLDAIKVFRLAMERGVAGSRYHAIGDEGVPVKTIAEVISRKLNVPLISKTREEAMAAFGFVGALLAADIPAYGKQTEQLLGFKPTYPGLIADMENGKYF